MSRHSNAIWRLFLAAIVIAMTTAHLFPYVRSSTAMAMPAAPAHGEVAAAIDAGDSRMNNYRLERDSCCVGEK